MTNQTFIKIFILILTLANLPGLLSAQEFKRFDEFNMQPEVWHFSGVQEAKVDAKGDLNFSIPIMTVPGSPGRDFNISFSYKAPILYHQTASWVGLGWNFDPGSITRDVQGDLEINGIKCGVDYKDSDTWKYMPDSYFVTIPGHGTVPFGRVGGEEYVRNDFFNKDPNKKFASNNPFYFEDYRPWKIEVVYTSAGETLWNSDGIDLNLPTGQQDVERFKVTTEDGVKYIFGLPSIAIYKSNINPTDPANSAYNNAWRLLAIVGQDFAGNENILLQGDPLFDENAAQNYIDWIIFKYDPFTGKYFAGTSAVIQNTYLNKVITPTHVAKMGTMSRSDVEFQKYVGPDRTEYNVANRYKALTSVTLFSKASGIQPDGQEVTRVAMVQDKSLAPYKNIPTGTGGHLDGKLTLKKVKFDGTPDYKFEYIDFNPSTIKYNEPFWSNNTAGRWYYDGYGYYNDGINPRDHLQSKSAEASAWALKKITFPTGATESYVYENDHIDDDIIYYHYKTVNGEIERRSYDFSDGRWYGGIRVKEIHRSEPLSGLNLTVTFQYGQGHAPCIPPKLVPWLRDLPGVYQNEYQALNRGKMDIVYDKIIKAYIGGIGAPALETLFYETHKPNASAAFEYKQGTLVTHEGFPGVWRLFTDNNTYNWGRLSKKEVLHSNVFKELTKYYYEDYTHQAGQIFDFLGGCGTGTPCGEIKQYSTLVQNEVSVYDAKYASGQNQFKTINKIFSPKTLQITEVTTIASDKATKEEYTYAHEKYSTMWDKNVLAPVAQKDIYFKDRTILRNDPIPAPTFTLQNSEVTVFREEGNWKDLSAPLITPKAWKVHSQYRLKTENELTQAPAFNNWTTYLTTCTDFGDWELQFRASAYNYGRLTEYADAHCNNMKIYYGDNTSPTDESALRNNFGRAYVTSVLVNGTLSKEFKYDTRFMQVSKIKDENQNQQIFQFDEIGRLKAAQFIDEQGNPTTVSEQDYLFSRDTNNDEFNVNAPNHVKTTIHYDGNNKIDNYDFYDGRGQKVQSVTDVDPGVTGTNEMNYYTASEPNFFGQTIRQYKPYEKLASANLYDPNFDINLKTTYQYLSRYNSTILHTSHPDDSYNAGRSLTENFLRYVSAKGTLPALYDEQSSPAVPAREFDKFDKSTDTEHVAQDFSKEPCDPVANPGCDEGGSGGPTFVESELVFYRTESRDENGNQTYTFQNAFGETILKRQRIDDGAGGTKNLDTHFHYDGAGNLIGVRPPNFFDPPTGSTAADWYISYKYNSLNQLTEKDTPDNDITKYLYDRNGNLRFVQDAKGLAENYFIYYKYDFLNRKVEEGKVTGTTAAAAFTQTNANIKNYPDTGSYAYTMQYFYDAVEDTPNHDTQTNLKSRLAQVTFKSEHYTTEGKEFYSYDVRGNVKWVEKHIPINSNQTDNTIVFVNTYAYDLQNNTTQMSYYRLDGVKKDELYVWYKYDKLGRLEKTLTNSIDEEASAMEEAGYAYTPNGQVERLSLAAGIQGVDYKYSVRDWVTDINHQNLRFSDDPGRDGETGLTYSYKIKAVNAAGARSDYSTPDDATVKEE